MAERKAPAPLLTSDRPRCVLGHDPGTTAGVTILRGRELVTMKEVTLKCSGPSRLLELADHLHAILTEHRPALYVLEDYAFGMRAQQGTYSTAEMGGIIRMLVAAHDIPLLLVAPSQTLKWITGTGVAKDKSQTPLHVFRRWGVECGSSHMAESYGLARLGVNILHPGLDVLTQPMKDVLAKHGKIDQDPRGTGVPVRTRGNQLDTVHYALRHWGTCPHAEAEREHRRDSARREAQEAAEGKGRKRKRK